MGILARTAAAQTHITTSITMIGFAAIAEGILTDMEYLWVEPNRRHNQDNIPSFDRKVIQDALVGAGVLEDDGWNYAAGFSDRFGVDKGRSNNS